MILIASSCVSPGEPRQPPSTDPLRLLISHPLPQVTDLYDPREQWASYLINALKAKELQARDTSYIVRGQEVIIVDEFTGRTMPGRRWGEGLHQVQLLNPKAQNPEV